MDSISSGNWKMQRQCWFRALFDTKTQKAKERKGWSEEVTQNAAQTSKEMENMKERQWCERQGNKT